MTVKERANPSRIPAFKDLEEEAAFWDTHSTADYEDEFKPVKVHFAKKPSRGIAIRLDAETLDKLRDLAHKQGIGPTMLTRMWILERLRETEGQHSSSDA